MKTIGIYKIINVKNGKYYIGSSKNIENRFKIHKNKLKNNKHINIILQRAWNKYGEESFVFEIVKTCKIENILLLEQEYLNNILDWNNVYNISKSSSGGDNIFNHPNKEIILKNIKNIISDYNKNLPEKERKKRSKNMSGEKNINFGGKLNNDENVRKKISENLKNFYKNNESHRKGKTNVEIMGEEKAKITSEKLSKIASERVGEKNPFFGKHHSKETLKKRSEKRMGIYYGKENKRFTIDDIEYFSLGDASKKLGIHITTISFRLRSKNKKFDNYQYIK